MKVFRFNGWSAGGLWHSPYAYLRCNPLETRAIKRRIAAGAAHIRHAPDAPGPRSYGAQFIVMVRRA